MHDDLIVDIRVHQHSHGSDVGQADEQGALGLVEGGHKGEQERGGQGRGHLGQRDLEEDPNARRAHVEGGFLERPIDALEGAGRNPDHREQGVDKLDQHDTRQGADQAEPEEDHGNGDVQTEAGESVDGQEGQKQALAGGELDAGEGVGGRQADQGGQDCDDGGQQDAGRQRRHDIGPAECFRPV